LTKDRLASPMVFHPGIAFFNGKGLLEKSKILLVFHLIVSVVTRCLP
jgi:hypothetical protein